MEKDMESHARRLDRVERARDENDGARRVLQRAQRDAEEFHAWSRKWRGECAAMLPADTHSRLLFDSLSSSMDEGCAKSLSAAEDALEENRRDRLELDARRDRILEDRERAARREGGPR